MSTRSTIIVTGPTRHGSTPETIRLYKHSDGYPTGNLPVIRDALTIAIAQHVADAARFNPGKKVTSHPNVQQVVGLLIGAASDVYGMGARIDDDGEDCKPARYIGYLPEHHGNQGDLEWQYVVDLTAKEVRVYNGDTTKPKFQDPRAYALQLVPEARAQQRKETEQLIKAIEALGFKVIGGSK